jgi:hypothetical protein
MKKILTILVLLNLTACATAPQWLASMYDQADACQSRAELNRPQGYQTPSWCGAGGKTVYLIRATPTSVPSAYITTK